MAYVLFWIHQDKYSQFTFACHNYFPIDKGKNGRIQDQKNYFLEVVPHRQIVLWKVKSFSHVRPFVTPWAVAYQAPLSMGFSRQ